MPQTVRVEPPEVFIDSGGLIALFNSDDAHHEDAITCRERILRYSRLFTSTAVVVETVGHFQRDHLIERQSLDSLVSDLLTPELWLTMLPVDDDVLRPALEMVRAAHDPRFSVVDASNLILMEKHKIDTIFSFDTMYDGASLQRGYERRFILRVGPPQNL